MIEIKPIEVSGVLEGMSPATIGASAEQTLPITSANYARIEDADSWANPLVVKSDTAKKNRKFREKAEIKLRKLAMKAKRGYEPGLLLIFTELADAISAWDETMITAIVEAIDRVNQEGADHE